jgi:hypothetical protein
MTASWPSLWWTRVRRSCCRTGRGIQDVVVFSFSLQKHSPFIFNCTRKVLIEMRDQLAVRRAGPAVPVADWVQAEGCLSTYSWGCDTG